MATPTYSYPTQSPFIGALGGTVSALAGVAQEMQAAEKEKNQLLTFSNILEEKGMKGDALMYRAMANSATPNFMQAAMTGKATERDNSKFFAHALDIMQKDRDMAHDESMTRLKVSAQERSQERQDRNAARADARMLIGQYKQENSSLESQRRTLVSEIQAAQKRKDMALKNNKFDDARAIQEEINRLNQDIDGIDSRIKENNSQSASVAQESVASSSVNYNAGQYGNIDLPTNSSSSEPSTTLLPEYNPNGDLVFNPNSQNESLAQERAQGSTYNESDLQSMQSQSSIPQLNVSGSSVVNPQDVVSDIDRAQLAYENRISGLRTQIEQAVENNSAITSPEQKDRILNSALNKFEATLIAENSSPEKALTAAMEIAESGTRVTNVGEGRQVIEEVTGSGEVKQRSVTSPNNANGARVLSDQDRIELIQRITNAVDRGDVDEAKRILNDNQSRIDKTVYDRIMRSIDPSYTPFSTPQLIVPSNGRSSSTISPSTSTQSSGNSYLDSLNQRVKGN